MRRLPMLISVAIVPLLWLRFNARPDPLPGFPTLVLWAWESPQDLRFVPPGAAAIGFLARTVWLDGAQAHSRPRLQPLRFSPGTDLMAVVRFEATGRGLPDRAEVVREVLPALQIAGVRALEIDFDARESERSWYAGFLGDLRQKMTRAMPLTITALESWCEEDRWIRGLPVAEATPMLFRMGPGERRPVTEFPAGVCGSSIGVSTDELPARVPRVRRTYVFHPGPWTREAFQAVVAQRARWLR